MRETYYRQQLKEAMSLLGRDPRTIFIGQTVSFSGSRFTYGTLENVPLEKRIELPIMEEVQMGMTLGLALTGEFIPVSIYPRTDFLLLAMNQLVNHIDKMAEISSGQYNPRAIIRATTGSTRPLHPGPQHCQSHVEELRGMLKNVYVSNLTDPDEIIPEYRRALERKGSSLLIDVGDLHFENEK